jgi:hypothetical protein
MRQEVSDVRTRQIPHRAPARRSDGPHANDNCRLARPAPVAPCRTGLVGRWRTNEQTGRLEQHWSVEALFDKREPLTRSRRPPAKGEYD